MVGTDRMTRNQPVGVGGATLVFRGEWGQSGRWGGDVSGVGEGGSQHGG